MTSTCGAIVLDSWDALLGHHAIRLQLTRSEPFAALLLAGPEGIGKSLVARWYAAWLNCENPPGAPPWDCSCLSCRKILNGNHPDIQVLRRESGKLTLGVQEVRDFIAPLAMRRYEGRCRVSLIEDAERLTEEAQSALLKTLEEPPPQQVLILICSQEFSLLPTVRSRCRLHRLSPLPVPQTLARLQEMGIPAERAALFSRLAEGRLGYALRLAKNDHLWSIQEEALNQLESLGSNAALWQALEVARNLETLKIDDGSEERSFSAARSAADFHLGLARILLRDLLILACQPDGPILLGHHRDRLLQLRDAYPVERLGTLLKGLEDSRRHLEANVNPRFVLQSMCLSLAAA